jgi:SSS family transporter
MLIASFLAFLLLFLLVGLWSATQSKKTTNDYLIAGKSIAPWLAGLSAVATNNSGYMFIGMIGVTYVNGLQSIWLMFGWIVGDLLAQLVAGKQIRRVSASREIHSFGGLLGHWHHTNYIWLRRVVGVLTLVLLGIYAAAQLKAGSKATAVLLDWPIEIGIIISAVIVLLYSIAGGIRASIWTDAAQSFVMLLGMLLLFYSGFASLGGMNEVISAAANISPVYLDWFPEATLWGVLLFIGGWFFGGIGVLGQPHIMVRLMSLDEVEHMNRMRAWYYLWFTVFYGATVVVGILARLILPEVAVFDPELALPTMAQTLLPEVFVGLVLAAMFAATMSTADSLILSCSAALTRDFSDKAMHSLKASKIATASILVFAVLVALSDNSTVFSLVLDAWGMLSASFAPLLLIYALGGRPGQWQAISVVLTGLLLFIIWPRLGIEPYVYPSAPAILTALLLYPGLMLVERIQGGKRE